MKSHAVALSLSLTLTVVCAMPPRAAAQFDLDLQATQIGNQLQEILNRITRYTTLLSQFTSLDCSAQGMAAGRRGHAIERGRRCLRLPSTCSARSEIPTGSYFKHRRICSIPPRLFQTGATYCKRRTRSPRPTSGTSTRAGPGAADAAVATFERRRNYADRSVVLAHAEVDATAALTGTLDAAERVVAGS